MSQRLSNPDLHSPGISLIPQRHTHIGVLLVLLSLSLTSIVASSVLLRLEGAEKAWKLLLLYIIKGIMIFREMKLLNSSITFCKSNCITNIKICTLLDASHSNVNEAHGQTGIICGRKVDNSEATRELNAVSRIRESEN